MNGQCVQDLRISLGPGVVDDDLAKTPFLAVPDELAIVAIHQERIFRSGARPLARHEMLRRHVAIKRRRIVAHLNLKIARRVAGIERTEQGNERVDDRFASFQPRKIETELFSRRPKIENAIFRQRRRERIRVAVIESKCEAMQRVRNFVAIVRQLHVGMLHRSPVRVKETRLRLPNSTAHESIEVILRRYKSN
jgi:hypothetical protein